MRIKLVATLFVCASAFAFTQNAEEIVSLALDSYCNGNAVKAGRLIEELGEIADPFWRAKAEIVAGLAAQAVEDLETAEKRYRKAEKIALSTPGLADTAAGYAIVSDAKSQLMLMKGIAYVIRNASAAEDYAKRALEIDPENVTALLVYAQGKVNAPRLFGGDVDLGIEILSGILDRDISNPQRLTTCYALSVAWEKKKQLVTAIRWIDAALELYPGYPDARERKKVLSSK